MSIAIPAPDEQARIACYLDGKCAEIDALIAANEVSVQKLKEYHQSTIYEAVTGKVEV
jgi:type I restriction enzyme S subunit